MNKETKFEQIGADKIRRAVENARLNLRLGSISVAEAGAALDRFSNSLAQESDTRSAPRCRRK